MALMSPTDSMFLIPETREQPMHVGSLQLYKPAPGASESALTDLYAAGLAVTDINPLFRKKAVKKISTAGQWAWEDDDDLDLEHHFRLSALPRPGRVRELLALTSRLHGTPLDRTRPLWETHLIEGLEDGRFAVYTKIHHALLDGVSGLRLLERSLTYDKDARDIGMPFAALPSRGKKPVESGGGLGSLPGTLLHAGLDTLGMGPKVLGLAQQALRGTGMAMPGQAPRSMLNVPITGSRRFAADAWEIDRIKKVAKKADATLNDVVLAMCSGALRDYLLSMHALPDSPLIAMTPVSLREKGDERTGNAVGSILADLGTHLDDPEQRLLTVKASMQRGKEVLRSMSQLQVSALSAVMMSPLLINQLMGAPKFVRPPFNVIISNVPGPRATMYWNGAELDGFYPLSIPTAGQALNITLVSYADKLQFGLTGCRRSLPHLQQLLHGLEESLLGLEKAFA